MYYEFGLGSKQISVESDDLNNLESSGIKTRLNVASNSQGIGGLLRLNNSGNLEEASSNSLSTVPCIYMATEIGVGIKEVLEVGYIRNDSWAFPSPGVTIYLSIGGVLTHVMPTGLGEIVQVIGYSVAWNKICFNPDKTFIELKS